MRMAGGSTGRSRAIRTSSIRLWGRSDMRASPRRIEDSGQSGRRGEGLGPSACVCLPGAPEEAVEPGDLPLGGVEDVGRVAELVPLVRVDHELGGDAERLQALPELEALRSRTLAVALAHHHQRWRL